MSRRQVLGAAVALPLARHPGLDPGSIFSALAESERWIPDPVRNDEQEIRSPAEWAAALAAYRAAEGGVEEAGRWCRVAPRAEIGAAEDAFGDRLEELYDALRLLLRVPAPDLGAFLVKVDAAFEHEIATLSGAAPCVAAIRRDVRRLRSGGA